MISDTLQKDEYNSYYKAYIDSAANLNIVEGLQDNMNVVVSFYSEIPEAKHNYAYSEGKWTIKDILLHIIDTERIFSYRALRIARLDKTPLSGFEQDDYVASTDTISRSLNSILEEYKSVRLASIALYKSFDDAALEQIGEASGYPISVRAMGYIMTGHENHHNHVIRERYIKEA